MARDYYEVLGVSRNAPEKDIRAAYRRLARQYHPDVNPGNKQAETRFKEINEAYQTLSGVDSRAKYDQFGEHWRRYDTASRAGAGAGQEPFAWSAQQAGRRRGRRVHFGDAAPEDAGGDIGEMFANLFSGRRGAVYEGAQPETAETPVTVTLEEAYAGARRLIEAQAGAFNGARRLEVRIPPGVDTGSRVHIAAPSAEGGPLLDVNLVITVAPHETFERKGDDLLVAVPVPLVDAMLGGEVEVPTIRGTRVALKLPAETQNGRTFRLKGQGMPHRKPRDGTTHGDLLATVKVTLPARLTREERALFERLRDGRRA